MAHLHVAPHVEVPTRTRRLLTAVAVVGAMATVVGMLVLRPSGDPTEGIRPVGAVGPAYDARVDAVDAGPCPGQGTADDVLTALCLDVTFELLEGPDAGERTTVLMPADSPTTPDFEVGEKVVLAYEEDADPDFRYSFLDRQRKPVLFWLAVIFALAVVAFGRLRGLAALGGLAASVVVLLAFVIPAIIDGRPPVWVAIVGASAIAYLVLYLAHGVGPMTTVALLGSLGALGATAALAQIFVVLARISGFATEEAIIVQLSAGEVDIAGLALAGMVIGALGALDDVTVTQASAVWELRAVNPHLGARSLYRSGIRIGRDHIASTVNTLLLAYAGASMPLLLFFVLSGQSLGTVANEEVVATEIIRTLVGSIGLVAAVPITTGLAARIASRGRAAADT